MALCCCKVRTACLGRQREQTSLELLEMLLLKSVLSISPILPLFLSLLILATQRNKLDDTEKGIKPLFQGQLERNFKNHQLGPFFGQAFALKLLWTPFHPQRCIRALWLPSQTKNKARLCVFYFYFPEQNMCHLAGPLMPAIHQSCPQ